MKLLGGVRGLQSAAAWVLAASATFVYYKYSRSTTLEFTASERDAWNAEKKKVTANSSESQK